MNLSRADTHALAPATHPSAIPIQSSLSALSRKWLSRVGRQEIEPCTYG